MFRSAENGLQEEEEEEEDLDPEVDASRLERFMRDRRRTRSLPAYPAALLDAESGQKRVKFADSLGLNLASVKHFSSLEEPRIPSDVLSRHRGFPQQPQDAGTDRLVPCFPEPRDAESRVRLLRVCLERVSVSQFDVRGQIRVAAAGEVGVRYTLNDWLSYVDAQAVPMAAADQPDAAGERYGFTVYTPPVLDPSAALHFAVYLKNEDGEFWDNNEGRNYTLRYRCLPHSAAFGGAALHDT